MAGITLAQAEAKLAEALDAESRIFETQEYQIAGRSNKRAMLQAVAGRVEYWDNKVKYLTARASGRGRSCTVSPSGR